MSKREFIENVIYYGIILGVVFLGGKYLLPIMTPFIIGFIIAYVAHEVSKKFTKDMNKATRIVILIGIYVVILVLTVVIIAYIVAKTKDFVTWAAGYSVYIEPTINNVSAALNEWTDQLPSTVQNFIEQMITSIGETLKNLLLGILPKLTSFVTNFVTSVPSIFVNVIVAIISSFYMLVDYDRVFNSLKKWVPKKVAPIASKLSYYIKNKLLKVLKSYIIIMGITFLELAVGLLVIKIPNSFTLAFFIAFLDILPVLGVGTVLIPWYIVDLILGNTIQGIALMILHLIITIIRNIIEPKLVGGDLGLEPLSTLVAMIVGMKLFGIVGLFGLPLTLSFILYARNEDKESNVLVS